MQIKFLCDSDGVRLDRFLSDVSDLSRSHAAALIESGGCKVAGATTSKKNFCLKYGSAVELNIPNVAPTEILPEDIPLDVVYEDCDVIVLNKPKGMVVHPAAGHSGGTLVNALLWRCRGELSGINGVARPGIVHRIDKDTSGLIAVAKNDAAHLSLSKQLKTHTMSRVYEAVCEGAAREPFTVNMPIGRAKNDRKKMAVYSSVADGIRSAVTRCEHLRVYERSRGGILGTKTLVRLTLETGRTHQIRVHMASRGKPLCGDFVYGAAFAEKLPQRINELLAGQCLHAKRLSFDRPSDGVRVNLECERPKYFSDFLKYLEHGIL